MRLTPTHWPTRGPLLVLVGLASLSLLETGALGQITPTGPDTRSNSLGKLQELHKQSDSGPQWLDIVRARGFIGELYTTTSRDNKPISIYHIINPLANQETLNRHPVLMFHGILMDASQTISHSAMASPRAPLLGDLTADPSDTALAFMLANNNFDVWMCEARGTSLNNHLVSDELNFMQAKNFWNFSLDEQIHYDLPVMLDFVLAQTGEDKLHYVGYSESTFMMFALLASQPEYQDKLASYTALAPVAYVEHLKGTGLNLFAPSVLVPESMNGNYVPQLFSDTAFSSLRQLCQIHLLTRTLCQGITSSLGGVGDNAQSAHFYSAAGKSTSIKAVRHFMQLYAQRRFGMYDYWAEGNMRQYGQPVPPNYPLANIKLPSILIIRGGNDFLSTPLDQKRLLAELGVTPYLDLNYPNYNHLDMLIGNQIVSEVNLPIARVMLDWTLRWVRLAGQPSIFRNATQSLLSRPAAPVAVSRPNGSRTVAIKSNLLNNLINGVAQNTNGRVVNGELGAIVTGTVTGATPARASPFAFVSDIVRTVGSLPFVG